MGQTAGQIENHIENQRVNLSSNLRELENRVKSATDWRQQFQTRPMTFLGAAFGGGLLLAAITRGSSPRRYYRYGSPIGRDRGIGSPGSLNLNKEPSPTMETAVRAWENIKGALIGVAAQHAKEYAEGFVPGFSQQYDKMESVRKA